MYFRPTWEAVAFASSMFAPGSCGVRKLMIETNPFFFSSGSAWTGVAPAHATVASTRV